MDPVRFDALARALSAQPSRRGVLRLLAGTALGGLLGARRGNAAAQGCSQVGGSCAARPCCAGARCTDAKKCVCRAGFTACQLPGGGQQCFDLKTDERHCGDCATRCTAGEQTCSKGHCCPLAQPTYCGTGPTTGVCVNTQTNRNHCGRCGNRCTTGVANATPVCRNGFCGFACNSGFTRCSGECIDLRTTPTDCGACGKVCDSTNGTASCSNGFCNITCDAGYANCDGDVATGCEEHTAGDPAHCGGCFQACDPGQACLAGTCTTLGCTRDSPCQNQCPQSSDQDCACGATLTGHPVCFRRQNGCAGHSCTEDGECADLGGESTCIEGFCSTPSAYCASDADCGAGSVCVNRNGGCGGCDLYTGGTLGICEPLCVG